MAQGGQLRDAAEHAAAALGAAEDQAFETRERAKCSIDEVGPACRRHGAIADEVQRAQVRQRRQQRRQVFYHHARAKVHHEVGCGRVAAQAAHDVAAAHSVDADAARKLWQQRRQLEVPVRNVRMGGEHRGAEAEGRMCLEVRPHLQDSIVACHNCCLSAGLHTDGRLHGRHRPSYSSICTFAASAHQKA